MGGEMRLEREAKPRPAVLHPFATRDLALHRKQSQKDATAIRGYPASGGGGGGVPLGGGGMFPGGAGGGPAGGGGTWLKCLVGRGGCAA
jgi:hypothetical protein